MRSQPGPPIAQIRVAAGHTSNAGKIKYVWPAVLPRLEIRTANRGKVNARKRKKRRGNPIYAEYQKGYRKENPDKFKSYQPKKNAAVQRGAREKRS